MADDGDTLGCTAQREYLFDVSNPSNPEEITPKVHPDGYWGWYYEGCSTGFNWVSGRGGAFSGEYFYRAALSVLDAHRLAQAVAPTADFSWTPTEIYPNVDVTFNDLSTSQPTAWTWGFQDATPAVAAVKNPVVQFTSPGDKLVTLTAENVVGPSTPVSKTVSVLDPAPQVQSVSVSPASPLQCQPITFTANGATGRPTLAFAWDVKNGGGSTVNSGGGNPYSWNTALTAPLPSPGTYTATVTVSNAFGAPDTAFAQFTLGGLTPLPGAGSFAPTCTNCAGSPPAPAADTASFSVNVAGATEWAWDFTGAGFGAFSSNPTTGPNPSHAYTAAEVTAQCGATSGVPNVPCTFPVRVKVRNCVEAERESAVFNVQIKQLIPLKANFSVSGLSCFPDPTNTELLCGAKVGNQITFNDASTGAEVWEYDWDGNGTFEESSVGSPITSHTYAATGKYRPTLRVKRGTSETDVYALFHLGLPEFIEVDPAQPASITLSGPSSGSPNAGYTFTASATNCSPAVSGWSWTTGGGSGSSSTDKITLSWSTTGSKTVAASNTACGSASGSKSISISSGTGGGGGAGGGSGGSFSPNFAYTPLPVKAGVATTFDASSSTGGPTTFYWTFGDGSAAVFGNPVSHTFGAVGTFTVTLVASKDGTCTGTEIPGLCVKSKVVQLGVATNGPPPPMAAFTVSTGATCISEFGFELCSATTGDEITFNDASTGTIESRSWNFGDGSTATGATATHAFAAPGTYQASLTVQGSGQSSTASRTFNVTGPAVSTDALVLTWFQRSHGALEQTSDFYVYNPGEQALNLSVTYLKRGKPNPTPPQKDLVIAPHATLFVADALKLLFNLDEGSGFLYFTWEGSSGFHPVITGTNNTKLADGTTFGQSFAAVTVARSSSAAAESTPVADQSLVGLADIAGESFSTFGVSNPFDAPANIELQFTDGAGAPLRPGLPVTIARNGQVLYQIEDIRALGMEDQDNYRVTVKSVSGGSVIPFAKKLRAGSQDQAFVPAIKTYQPKVLLLGTYSGDTVRGNRWSTDAVLFNPTTAELVVEARFIPVGVDAQPAPLATFHLQPKESRRLVDILKTEWDAQGVNGYIQFETTNGGSGPYAGILGEIYDYSDPGKIYGNVFGALSADDAAGPGKSLALVGLAQNASFTTTLWFYNPGPGPAQAEIIYRASSDGRELARTLTGSPEGTMRLINPGAFPAAVQNSSETFTIEMHVNFGQMVASALMVSSATKDPTYVVGVAH